MTTLGGLAIERAIRSSLWTVTNGESGEQLGVNDINIGPNSVDITLGGRLMADARSENCIVDFRDETTFDFQPTCFGPGCDYVLAPGACALGFARERFDCVAPISTYDGEGDRACQNLHRYYPIVDGRSTIGRGFLAVHVTAGRGDFGFCGCFTLELVNQSHRPIRLFHGMRIGQVTFERVQSPFDYRLAGGHAYNGCDHLSGPVPPVTGPGRV